MQLQIKQLSRADRPALDRHFLALGPEDRWLRFGGPSSDFAVHAYVKRIDFDRDAAFGVSDDGMQLLGAAHLARGDGHVELGVSILPGCRGRGIDSSRKRHARQRTHGESGCIYIDGCAKACCRVPRG